MASLVSTAEVRALVKTALQEDDLQVVIDRVEAEITEKIGVPQDDTGNVIITETVPGGWSDLFVKRPISSVDSITEDGTVLAATSYRVWGDMGVIERLPAGTIWGEVCIVAYKPADQRHLRKQAIIDLVRLVLERTALQSESIAGEYRYEAPDWEKVKRKIMRRLTFTEV